MHHKVQTLTQRFCFGLINTAKKNGREEGSEEGGEQESEDSEEDVPLAKRKIARV